MRSDAVFMREKQKQKKKDSVQRILSAVVNSNKFEVSSRLKFIGGYLFQLIIVLFVFKPLF